MKHHPVFYKFQWSAPACSGSFSINSMGVRQRRNYDSGVIPTHIKFTSNIKDCISSPKKVPPISLSASTTPDKLPTPDPSPSVESFAPQINEEYFEWIDILESINNYAAQHRTHPYTFIELGAGFGRWSVNAIAAYRQANINPFRIIAVEADEQHYKWLQQHFLDNDISPYEQTLINMPLTGDGRDVHFLSGNHGAWFGQAIIDDVYAQNLKASFLRRIKNRIAIGQPTFINRLFNPLANKFLLSIPSITLNEVIKKIDNPIDIIDIDVQGVEAEIIEATIGILTEKVMRLHIGTHSHDVEHRLDECLSKAGWELIRNYPCLGNSLTEYGNVAFGDGVQSWVNPRFR